MTIFKKKQKGGFSEDYKKKERKLLSKFPLLFGVRWARLELAQDYSHYPLKVACLPFHHHRFVVLGLQRYAKNYYFQTFLRFFSIFSHFFLKIAPKWGFLMF